MRIIRGEPYVPGVGVGSIIASAGRNNSGKVLLLSEANVNLAAAIGENCPAAVILCGVSRFSHLAIYLWSKGIPCVAAGRLHAKALKLGQMAGIDGQTGAIAIGSLAEIQRWSLEIGRWRVGDLSSEAVAGALCTVDGVRIYINGSVSDAEGARVARMHGADEIGLVRTEFLPRNAPMGTIRWRRELAELSNDVCAAAGDLRVTFRLLDVGGEKSFDWAPHIPGSEETLGVRGARMLNEKKFSKWLLGQLGGLREIASKYSIGICVPFVSNVSEFVRLKALIRRRCGDQNIKIGAMVETPALCYTLAEIACEADFLSIGTNDMMECFFGANRTSAEAARYIDPHATGFLRFLAFLGKECRKLETEVQVCGQLPLLPCMLAFLIGAGFRRFSVEPLMIPWVKQSIRNLSGAEMERVVVQVTRTGHPSDLAMAFRMW